MTPLLRTYLTRKRLQRRIKAAKTRGDFSTRNRLQKKLIAATTAALREEIRG